MIPPAVASASADVATSLMARYRTDRGVHSETIIGAAAALAGEFALRAMEPKLPESGWVASEKAIGFIFGDHGQGTAGLWDFIREGAIKVGAAQNDLPDPAEVAKRVAGAVGGSPFPPLSVPDRHFPHEWSPNACPRLRPDIEKIATEYKLSGENTATALALAIVLLIAQTKSVLPPAVAATLALEVMLGVAHMAPMKAPV